MDESFASCMYYVAIVCPPVMDEKVFRCKLWMKEQFGCMVALKSPAHITLIPPFWMEETRETELQKTLQSFESGNNEMEIQLDGFSHFNQKVLFINVKDDPSLCKLEKQTTMHFMQSFSDVIRKDLHPFHPHITIANRDMRPYHFEKAWRYFSCKEFKETFPAKTISLLKLSAGKWNVIGEKSW